MEEWEKRAGQVVVRRIERGVRYFIAYDGDEPAGFSVARIDHEQYLAKGIRLGLLIPGGVCVVEKYRGRRIGSVLLSEALTYLKTQGMEKARVWTFAYLDSYPPAVNMYLKDSSRGHSPCERVEC